ncbi:MAG: hypothetical protein LUE11_00105 [Clostridia bacterium]|nr:hypothetical protein [Clostridia bacterium]
MKRMIRPADEEFGNAIPLAAFIVLWYAAIIRQMTLFFTPTLIIFAVGGLLPLHALFQSIHRALFYRKKRKQVIAYGRAMRGKITGVAQKMVPYSGKNGRLRFKKYYYLQVDIWNPMTGANTTVESQAYRKPIHCYLSSPDVLVYTDNSGLQHYLEDFKWKTDKREPDIFSYPETFDDRYPDIPVFQIVFVLIAILMLLHLLR